ncbi:YVTN family beta-propeller protein [Microbacteriaceae bacterium SG_E_30_P1]|uniref:YVTN family beta-propeller protein n=1 Tax=Antiquaquibacter oligotrophicus TaxID=2880260 RepID=A0ABT6KJA5_9MICO|nr:PQQ-binding-like beta-propeller repeat protein [Antiquaquibacter oligotrophicus]MDH6179854.1 YVTN family beta-propeller protein [Antiquaquibacter oligotrophicus]UDF14385.1 PQQ-binding-like beta-propeller repeat protein [Antiquaquibacter oligotrophicus]
MPAGRLLVVCKDDQALEVIDLPSGTTVGSIRASGYTPHEVAATVDGTRAYLPIYSDAWLGDPGTDGRAVDVIDLVGLRVEKTIPLGIPSRPHLPAVGPGGLLYVGTELDESITVVDPASGELVARLPTGRPQSHMFVLSPDGARAYSANVDTGTVSIIDVATRALVSVVEVADKVNRISISPDGRTVYTADQRNPRLAAIDTDSGDVSWIDLPALGFGTAVTPDGGKLIVALRWESRIGVIDLADPSRIDVTDVPSEPQAIIIHPDGTHAYSACDADGAVVEVDIARAEVTRTFLVGRNPDGLCWAATP